MTTSKNLLYGSLTIAGLSFWFLLAFPFANHNESYLWLAQLPKLSMVDVLTKPIRPVSTFRPLAQATAWLLHWLFAGSIYPAQALNFLLAASGWLILFGAMKEKRVFSLVALMVGGCFFSGYIYLFHLHGLCYCLLPVLVALLFRLHHGKWTRIRARWLFLFAVVASLLHPFSLVLYIAAAAGALLEQRKEVTGARRAELITLVVLAAGICAALALKSASISQDGGFFPLVSYKMTEINRQLSMVAFLLSFATIASMGIARSGKALLAAGTTILAIIFYKLAIPLIIIWGLLCLMKTLTMKAWSLGFLLTAAFCLPATAGTGSPTHAIIFLMLCAAVVPMDWINIENRLSSIKNRVPIALLLFLGLLIILLRAGADVPVVSKLANPLLAEREKSTQLEQIASWVLSSEYKDYSVKFGQGASDPSKSGNAIDRRYRPPARQEHFAAYMDYKRGPVTISRNLLVAFGNEPVAGAKELRRFKGRYAGDAVVYLPSK